MTTLELCRSTLAAMIRQKWLPTFKVSGRFRPQGRDRPGVPKDLAKLLWYARLEGALYQDALCWRVAYRAVDSFRQHRPEVLHSEMIEDEVFGVLAAPLQDVQRFLVTAFSALDFRCMASDPATQTAWFSSQHSCTVEDLPEPYGKWVQIKQKSPKWEQPSQLSLQARCTLDPRGPRSCVMRLVMSTFAPALLERLAEQIGALTSQTLRPPHAPLGLADPRLAWLTNGPLPT
jgi:hypothetical protein